VDALRFTFHEQLRSWTRHLHTPVLDRGPDFRLQELAWLSAIRINSFDYQMTALTYALRHGASMPQIAGALGVDPADVVSIRRQWQPWAEAKACAFAALGGPISPEDYAHILRFLDTAEGRGQQ
jgi:hypothetical protein